MMNYVLEIYILFLKQKEGGKMIKLPIMIVRIVVVLLAIFDNLNLEREREREQHNRF